MSVRLSLFTIKSVAQRDRGVAVLVVSAELDEVLGLADRVAVVFDGHIVATLDAADATRERVGLLMAGSVEETVDSLSIGSKRSDQSGCCAFLIGFGRIRI